ncbi:PIR1 Cell wall mannoprotein PIR1 [Candida maltosa Xu316]|uniref:Covalently-linked cell wall protein, putative (Soluble cell wall protein, putative) n=1 Tax=Candida maltosa (strain Xu316) TaxID=1245528 RepID=M3K6E1_CANMX|nr:Covalently-linked cell wall protein, putative (Soluble cell wall protein, putative) [Candida maltosa Xu316]
MKFSTAVFTFAFFTAIEAGVSKPTYYNKPKQHGKGLETVEYEFALGVKENCDYKNDDIFIVFEIGDGQLEHDNDKYKCNGHKQGGLHDGGDKKYKRGGNTNDDDCDDNCDYCRVGRSLCRDTFSLCDGILKDDHHFTGEIVSNHQFQFDKTVQSGSLYSCGFSIVDDNCELLLALNGCTEFWECPVDDCGTYKLYDSCIDSKCKEIEIVIVLLEEEQKKKHDGGKKW